MFLLIFGAVFLLPLATGAYFCFASANRLHREVSRWLTLPGKESEQWRATCKLWRVIGVVHLLFAAGAAATFLITSLK